MDIRIKRRKGAEKLGIIQCQIRNTSDNFRDGDGGVRVKNNLQCVVWFVDFDVVVPAVVPDEPLAGPLIGTPFARLWSW